MELDSAGASVLLSPASVSEEPEADDPEPLWREEPDRLALPLPVLVLPEPLDPLSVPVLPEYRYTHLFDIPPPLDPLSVPVLPEPLVVAVPPLPEASVTIVAFIFVLFPAV